MGHIKGSRAGKIFKRLHGFGGWPAPIADLVPAGNFSKCFAPKALQQENIDSCLFWHAVCILFFSVDGRVRPPERP